MKKRINAKRKHCKRRDKSSKKLLKENCDCNNKIGKNKSNNKSKDNRDKHNLE